MREPEHIRRHRTLARLVVPLLLLGALVSTSGVASAAPGKPDRILFPVVGKVTYTNDFGAARWQGSHEGNDLMAAWKAPVVAVEPGTVKIHTGSASAGCMLYLYGKSGATYLYIHLNNDRGPRNDNKGGCKPGVAFAPGLESGQKVRAGEMIGYVGDSGDANGVEHHLHFEYHPKDGRAVSPFKLLRKAERLLFAVPASAARTTADAPLTLTLAGTVIGVERVPAPAPGSGNTGTPAEPPPAEEYDAGQGPKPGASPSPPPPPPPARPAAKAAETLLTIRVTTAKPSSGGKVKVSKRVSLRIPGDAVLESREGKKMKLGGLAAGARVTVTTGQTTASLEAQLGRPGVLAAARVLVRAGA